LWTELHVGGIILDDFMCQSNIALLYYRRGRQLVGNENDGGRVDRDRGMVISCFDEMNYEMGLASIFQASLIT
jgi:hypothetical protein